jgi:hypothetical protein
MERHADVHRLESILRDEEGFRLYVVAVDAEDIGDPARPVPPQPHTVAAPDVEDGPSLQDIDDQRHHGPGGTLCLLGGVPLKCRAVLVSAGARDGHIGLSRHSYRIEGSKRPNRTAAAKSP